MVYLLQVMLNVISIPKIAIAVSILNQFAISIGIEYAFKGLDSLTVTAVLMKIFQNLLALLIIGLMNQAAEIEII
jgi:hypothetical protein